MRENAEQKNSEYGQFLRSEGVSLDMTEASRFFWCFIVNFDVRFLPAEA